MMLMRALALIPILKAFAAPSIADAPVILGVRVADGQISVSVSHPDSGWDHFADLWRVFGPDEELLAERILLHPHETEQPFTRSTRIVIPDNIDSLSVVAYCTHQNTSLPFTLALTD